MESEKFRSRDFSLVPLAQGLQVPGSSFSAFWQGHFSVSGPQSRSILPIKTHFGVPKAKSTVLWSLELSLVL